VLVADHHGRADAAPRDRLIKEGAGTLEVSALAEQHIDDLASLVDRAIQIRPPAGDPDVGLIDPPPPAARTSPPPPLSGEQRPKPVGH
jgi:hypothetical protein